MENIWPAKEKKTEKEKEENVWRRKMLGLWRRRKLEKEKNESVLGRDILMHRGEEQKKQKVCKSVGEGRCHDGHTHTHRRNYTGRARIKD